MKNLLPFRHKSDLSEKLNLIPFPNNIAWNGSIIYLDRDGVLNIGSENYINSPEELQLLPNVGDCLVRLRNEGYRLCLVTNQSPINRGLWDHEMLEKIHDKLILDLKEQNQEAYLDLILYSPYTPYEDSISRKPYPGMLWAGNVIINASELGLSPYIPPNMVNNLASILYSEGVNSAMVGDRIVDYKAGKAYGIRSFLVDADIGLSQVIDRILDKNDKGDVLH